MLRRILRGLNRRVARLDRLVGRRLTGADCPATRAARSQLHITRLRYRANIKPTSNPAFSLSFLENQGFLNLPDGYYKPDLVTEIGEQVSRVMQNKSLLRPSGKPNADGDYFSWIVRSAHASVPAAERLLTPELKDYLEAHFRTHIHIPMVRVYRNLPVPAEHQGVKEYYASRWHWDQRYLSMLKLFFLVHETTVEHGPFHYHSVPTSSYVLQNGYHDRQNYDAAESVLEDPARMGQFIGEPGKALLCNTARCAHKAGKPAPGHTRDMVLLQILPSDKPLARNWMELASRTKSLGDDYK